MLFLGIDTSGKSGGVTLAEGDPRSFRILGFSPIAGGTFSAQLVPTIARLLESYGKSLSDVAGFAVASGPGSFTGLRVGLSAVKGLAEVLAKPIATVSLLEALAIAPGRTGRIAAALDAGRSEIFFGLYEVSATRAALISESLLSRGQFQEQLRGDLQLLVTSDSSVAQMARGAASPVPVEVADRPDSSLIARVGLKKLLHGETVSIEALDANYIRRSDAEIFSRPKVQP
ncbi:MAG TPA: tRNA (adenosine(37)-N6)-threonylcarbamoyltransferase complex dimerization subunit type 1 TsaB [Candidatus Angelobacter sp.]|nr:tRNA (adenosine(37)-N6)-threonylcarbamoyltransferase complex dimerization subunit type 1 TsaB [Candidatus Angelobacter sp.]